MTTSSDLHSPKVPAAEAPPRALSAASWLAYAAPADDYLRGKHPRVDTSLWGVLFSWIAPLGITLGILGIVRGSGGTKNISAIVWGVVAIVLSIVIPIVGVVTASSRPAAFTLGPEVESNLGVSLKIPEGARLLDDTYAGLLYDVSEHDDQLQWYGAYPVYVTDAATASNRDTIQTAIDDANHEYHRYWLYQLFEVYGYSVYSIESVQLYNDTLEVVLTLTDDYSLVATLHFIDDETIFVQYTYGSLLWLPYALSVDSILGVDATEDAKVWHQLVDSFSYNPDEYEYELYSEDIY